MDVVANPSRTPVVSLQSFSVRLAQAKKAAVETALKHRQESLKAADLNRRPVSNTAHVSKPGGIANVDDTEAVAEPVANTEAIPSAHPYSSRTPRTPFKVTKLYSQLRSAHKRTGQRSIKKADTRFSPSTSKSPMETSTSHPVSAQIVQTRTTRHISSWYDSIDTKCKYSRADLETIRYFITLRKKCEKAVNSVQDSEHLFSELRARLHQMEFYDFLTGVLIRKSRILEDEGLPSIFDGRSGVFPWDICADSQMLYQKWAVGHIDPHLLRGIEDKRVTKSDGKVIRSRRFASGYEKISPNYVGAGHLVNGMWWPFQFCALRDGAHGETEAGIHGQIGSGAYSIVVSNGGYANVDEGNRLKYCGTSGSLGQPSQGTKLMKEAFFLRNAIRVLRSASLPAANPFRPAKGLRYDGLYEITGYEILDEEVAMHRFSLKRRDEQEPIRYQGVESRPTSEELVEYAKIRKLLGLSL